MSIRFLIGCISFFLLSITSNLWAIGNPNSLLIKIINSSTFDLRVKEGAFFETKTLISQGQYAELPIFFDFITNLSIKYQNNIGEWVKAPGCPEGSFLGSLRVTVSVNPFSPDVPLCSWNLIG